MKKNKHIGSSIDDFMKEEGFLKKQKRKPLRK